MRLVSPWSSHSNTLLQPELLGFINKTKHTFYSYFTTRFRLHVLFDIFAFMLHNNFLQ